MAGSSDSFPNEYILGGSDPELPSQERDLHSGQLGVEDNSIHWVLEDFNELLSCSIHLFVE